MTELTFSCRHSSSVTLVVLSWPRSTRFSALCCSVFLLSSNTILSRASLFLLYTTFAPSIFSVTSCSSARHWAAPFMSGDVAHTTITMREMMDQSASRAITTLFTIWEDLEAAAIGGIGGYENDDNDEEQWRTVEQLLSVSLSGWSELEFPFRLGRDTGRGSLTRWQEDGKPHHLHPQEPSHPEPRPPSLCRCYQTQRACSDQQESYNIRVKPAEFNTHTELSWKVTCKERGRVSVGVWVCVEHWSFLFLFPSLPVMILDELKLQICSRQRNETQKRETEKRKTKKRSIRKKTYFTAAFMFSCQLLARRSHKPHPLIHKTTAPNAHHVYLRCDWLRGNSLCGLAKHLFKHL